MVDSVESMMMHGLANPKKTKYVQHVPRTRYRIIPLTNMNKYSHNDTSETEVNINVSVNNSSEEF